MPGILIRLREAVRDIASRVLLLTLRKDVVDVSLDGEANHKSQTEKAHVFQLACSSSVLKLQAVTGLDDHGLGAIFSAHTCSCVQKIIVQNHPNVTTLPRSLGSFVNVCHLDLSYNSLSDLPWSLVYLNKLTVLNLSNNKFASLPPILGHLATLETLLLKNNDLRFLPTSLINLQHLKKLDLTGNAQLQSPPPHVYSLGKDAVFDFLSNRLNCRNLWQNCQRCYTENDGSLTDDIGIKSLLELCVSTVLQFKVDYFMQMSVPQGLKTYLHEKEMEKVEAIKVAKCSRCNHFFSSQVMFNAHDCVPH